MKKIVIASLATAAMAGAAGSASAAVTDFTAGAGTTTITNANCGLFAAGTTAKVNLSASNIGSFDCNTTSGSVGVAITNTNGKFVIYSISSAGGALASSTYTAAQTSTTNTQTLATSAGSSS